MPESRRSSVATLDRLATAAALHAGGEIEADGLRVRGQGVEALPAQPGGELPPIGLIGALGVVGAGVAGVVARLVAEGVEMRRAGRGTRRRTSRRRRGFRSCPFAHCFGARHPDGSGRVPMRVFWVGFVRHLGGFRIMSDKRTLSDMRNRRQAAADRREYLRIKRRRSLPAEWFGSLRFRHAAERFGRGS